VADGVNDGNQTFRIGTSDVTSNDPRYGGTDPYNPPDVTGTTINIDIPALVIGGVGNGLVTSEAGTTAQFTVRLSIKPTSNVTIPLSVNRTSEAKVSPTSLTFTPQNFSVAQIVTVRGLNDAIEDGDMAYNVILGVPVVPSGGDSGYANLDKRTVAGVNRDDDDTTAPVVTITSPRNNDALSSLSAITGTAQDVAGQNTSASRAVVSVSVSLLRLDDPATSANEQGYYNSTTNTFGSTQTLNPATYDASTLRWTLALTSLPQGKYRAQAFATDRAGNKGTSAVIIFTLDLTAPTVLINTPGTPSDGKVPVFTRLTQVAGTASDSGSGVRRVRVQVVRQEKATNGNVLSQSFLLADGTFSPTAIPETLLPAIIAAPNSAGTVNFTLDLPELPSGNYYVRARVDDNVDNPGFSAKVFFFIRNTSPGPDDFQTGQTYLISLPYMDSAAPGATTTPDRAFSVEMFDPVTNEQRYQLIRYNAITGVYEPLLPDSLLKRGEGYFLKALTTNLRILRPADDPTRIPMDPTIDRFTVTLRRNPSANADDPNNGFNLIGDPFNPESPASFIAADWTNATVEYNGVTYATVTEAAAAGIVDARLFTFNSATGQYEPVDTNIEVFKGYFVRTIFDGVKVTLKAVSATPGQ
jgi:hypothetical protein